MDRLFVDAPTLHLLLDGDFLDFNNNVLDANNNDDLEELHDFNNNEDAVDGNNNNDLLDINNNGPIGV
ncbi:hypothetical protein QR680_008062 [Steinernema hermaphroditum]|uniref:Uncharacterized protein n=1 Tax=Steinernema hermaphroditum TaxID=289476 RepID=A0AA39IF69_9BILA|nr:hypothetical protein QR680_008062 [Steinernema hermaphroditum]